MSLRPVSDRPGSRRGVPLGSDADWHLPGVLYVIFIEGRVAGSGRRRAGPARPRERGEDGTAGRRSVSAGQALACMDFRARLPCFAAFGSVSSFFAATPAAILSPVSLSMLRQYSNARSSTGSLTALSR